MGDRKNEPGSGDVPITLGGEELVLKPSLEACIEISKLASNSLMGAIARCDRLDFEFICEVIALGLGATSPALKKDVREKVYRVGVIACAADTILFIRTIMNGGVRPNDDEEGDDGSAGPLADLGIRSSLENSTES